MNKLFSILMALLCVMNVSLVHAGERQLAFPEADGYGRFVTGGRGGEVCYVTRLDDCSDNDLVEGTLRWALRHDNGGKPRTILFNVSGTIYLTSKLKFQYGNVSILGQSAPGGGICLTGYNMYICKNNVIIRHIRFRAGDIPSTSMTGLDMENAKRVILDHCSMTWSMEECLTAYDTDSTTVQWCIIGEGLYNSKNSKGARAYATQWGGEHSTMHHTLITNSHSRAPRFNGVRAPSSVKGQHDYQVDSEFANNVVFNWSGAGNQYGGEYDKAKVEVNFWNKSDPGYDRVYLINNYYRPGPATKKNCGSKRFWCAPSSPYGQWYLSGNKFEVDGTYSSKSGVWSKAELDKVNADNYYGAQAGNSSRGIDLTGTNFTKYVLNEIPYKLSGMSYESADEAYQQVVNKAGASLPRYDEVDKRLIDEAAGRVNPQYAGPSITSEPGIIDSPNDVKLAEHDTYYADGVEYNNFPFLGMRPGDRYMVDSDGDGLPDLYEDEIGLNKEVDADAARMADNGYTYLENYMNGIADGTIDKSKYETSDTPVTPGQNKHPETVTVKFKFGNASEGDVPDAVTMPWGGEITIPRNYFLYKEEHTLTSWTFGDNKYRAGDVVKVNEDMALVPDFEPNPVTLDLCTTNQTFRWDFTEPFAPIIEEDSGEEGSYVSQNEVEGHVIDASIYYIDNMIILPWRPKAIVKVDGQEVEVHPYADKKKANVTVSAPLSELTVTFILDDSDASSVIDMSRDINYNCAPYDVAVHDADQLREALAAAAARQDKEERYRIFLHNGTYDFGTIAKTAVPAMTSLIGESQTGVLILNNPGAVTSNYQELTPVLFIDQNQNDVYMQDLTIRQARDWATKTSKGQCVALRQRGKRAAYKNVTLQGVQDTYYLNKADATAYFETSTVSGEVDFIYGDGTMWFEECILNPISSKAVITASNAQTNYKGIIFNHCTIDGVAGYKLGRPWGDSPAVTYLYTQMNKLPTDAGWGSMTSGLKLRFHEFGSTDATGKLLDLSKRSISACGAAAGSDAPVLTQEQADAYTLTTTFKDWDPKQRTQQLSAPTLTITDGMLKWNKVAGALGYAILRDGQVVGYATAISCKLPDDVKPEEKWSIRAANQMGGLGLASNAIDLSTGISTLSADTRPVTVFNLNGQPIPFPRTPGLYIVNGKARFIKNKVVP